MKPFNTAKLCCILLALLCIPNWAHALPDDANQNTYVDAEKVVVDERQGTITYIGSVLMQQGSIRIQADQVVLFGKEGKPSRVTATGLPAKFQQTPKLDTEPVKAQANRLEYAVDEKTLVLLTNASLKQEGMSLSGNKIEYDVINSVVKAGSDLQGSEQDKRVRMVIPPKAFEEDQEEQ